MTEEQLLRAHDLKFQMRRFEIIIGCLKNYDDVKYDDYLEAMRLLNAEDDLQAAAKALVPRLEEKLKELQTQFEEL
jgi:hypothetical protein